MKLTLQQIDKTGIIKLAADGEITIRDFLEPGKNPFETVLGPSWGMNNVLLGLEKVSFVDSSAIGWLIESQRKFAEKGGRLVIHSPTPRVRDVIELLKMRQVLTIRDNESQGRQVFEANVAPAQG